MASSLAKQVASCNRRARDRGLAHTLTTLDWQRTLNFFEHHCVYWGGVAWTIDHFQSLAYGGGSTHSNCVPSCISCNAEKASTSPRNLTPSFVNAERLAVIRDYLEAIGRRNQEHWRRLCEREAAFARMDEAVARLKSYCESHALESPIENAAYGYLRGMIFGVEWDPSYYFQVLISLNWQKQYSTFAPLTAACEDALRVLHEENNSNSTEIEKREI